MQTLFVLLLFVGAVLFLLVAWEIRKKNVHIWIGSYLSSSDNPEIESGPTHILFAFCDHFEPRWGGADPEKEDARVDRWCKEYPQIAQKHQDADGCYPKHSFFYPEEEYSPVSYTHLTLPTIYSV